MTAIPMEGATAYVSFSAEVNAHTTESLIAAMANCAMQGAAEVNLLLSTPGGSVMNGMNLYNVLRSFPFKLVTHNVGNVDSIGNVIFLAADTRYACAHSTFMFHGVQSRRPQGNNQSRGEGLAGALTECRRRRKANGLHHRGAVQPHPQASACPLPRSSDQGRCICR